jgi:hypothetical protein
MDASKSCLAAGLELVMFIAAAGASEIEGRWA